jgi:predicted nucleic acid-binding protein
LSKRISSTEILHVFLDACCWYAACRSRNGGSALLLQRGMEGKVKIYTSVRVEREIVEHVSDDLGEEGMRLLELYMGRVKPIKVTLYPARLETKFAHLTMDANDIHVLAAAYHANVDILVSLDKKHIVTEKVKSHFPISVLHTKEFFQQYPELRSDEY